MNAVEMVKARLFTPGPTPVPEEVALAMARPLIHHRSDAFAVLYREIQENLQYVFQTGYDVLPLACSGTGAMETAVINLLSPGQTALTVGGGKFAERWQELCTVYGIKTVPYPLEWGASPDPVVIEQLLDDHPAVTAVFTTQCETSTGALADIEAIGAVTGPRGILLVTDAITGTGVHPLYPEKWNVDVVVAGSQKGLMIPPGLGFLALSPRAWEAVANSTQPRYYFDLRRARQAHEKNQTAFTPATSLLTGLHQALTRLRAEGMDTVWERHAHLADMTRRAVRALGLSVLPVCPCNVLTPVCVPETMDGRKLLAYLQDRCGLTAAGGQGALKGKIIRISHTGYVDRFDALTAVSALEEALRAFGHPAAGGTAAAAALSELTVFQRGVKVS